MLIFIKSSINDIKSKTIRKTPFCYRKNILPTSKRNDIYSGPKTSMDSIDQEFIGSMIIGLGTWRLRPIIRSKASLIIARLEGIIRQCCTNDDLDIGNSMGYEYLDTKDPTGRKAEVEFYANTTHSQTGDVQCRHLGLQLENRVFSSRVFRKIHIGVATRLDGQEVIYLLMYPRPQFYLPILCANIKIDQNKTIEAIVDTSSVRKDNFLPNFYFKEVESIQNSLSIPNSLPNWGSDIFSPLCVNLKLTETSEINRFIDYICSLCRLHLQIALLLKPISWEEKWIRKEIVSCHHRFCKIYLKSEINSAFLKSSFGKIKTEKYLREFIFDVAKYV